MDLCLVSKETAWIIDSSMFVIDGSWETGYYLDIDLARVLNINLNIDYAPVKSGMGVDWGTRKKYPQVFGKVCPFDRAYFFV